MDTNPDFQHHRIDDAADYSDEVKHIPGIFEKVLHHVERNRRKYSGKIAAQWQQQIFSISKMEITQNKVLINQLC